MRGKEVKNKKAADFLGGAMNKNPSASGGDMGLIPGPEHSTCHGATKPMDRSY